MMEYRKYMCIVCGYIYDAAQGAPEEGIPAGTRWEDVPVTWTCPDCGASKEDFEMMEI
jgi:rubredoxin